MFNRSVDDHLSADPMQLALMPYISFPKEY